MAAALDGWRLRDKARDNAGIAAGVAERPAPTARAELRFAHASGLVRRGDREAAIDAYRVLQDDSALGQAARYNAANQLLMQALVLRDSRLPGQALPLIELAKAGYRDVLRLNPDQWDARYNLERAQRLQPDPDDAEADATGPPENAERAATTMRGVSRGLP
ncbi:MxaK protein [Methylibium sp.]|uniref:MxaK protein n=1 Tax=Methylibium sp. TaxID=2067992 RepID=UPI003D0D6688